MAIKKSISGIRGTIGGVKGENLTPIDLIMTASAYGEWARYQDNGDTIIIGRDGRISGKVVLDLVTRTLQCMGLNVIDLDLTTTPTVEMAVLYEEKACGGIVISASHNPREWNALKLLNHKGEFLSKASGDAIIASADKEYFTYSEIDDMGSYVRRDYHNFHMDQILRLPYVSQSKISKKKFNVVVDCINSTGAIAIPILLDKLGVRYTLLNDDVSGEFSHNPEPLPRNLKQLSDKVIELKADIGIAVDPDVDRLVLVCEDGSMFGEEYTIVAVADYILGLNNGGNTVSNLSSSRALSDLTVSHGGQYSTAEVGEVNVVAKMKAVNAIFGGEGNGGVILPELHYGRDALVGIALVLNLLVERNTTLSQLKRTYPQYVIEKTSIKLDKDTDISAILTKIEERYSNQKLTKIDGLKIDYKDKWVHIRESNTEPILRIIAEAKTSTNATDLIKEIQDLIL